MMPDMPSLHELFAGQVEQLRAEREQLLAGRGEREISRVTVAQAHGGLRGVNALICDTSTVDPERGLFIRGIPVTDLLDRFPEDIFFLLLMGRLPSNEETKLVRDEIAAQERVPEPVWRVINEMSAGSNPMAMLATGLLALENESVMSSGYDRGLKREDYWKATLTDALRVLGSLPTLGGGVYRMRFKKGPRFAHDPLLDWSQNYCAMCGVRKPVFFEAMRRAAILQSDHEGGNVCAFTCHTVGSVLSNAFLAVSAGFNGLAGPLHGRAAKESTDWVVDAVTRYRGIPTDAQVEEYAAETLKNGRVIPGHGHAVLRDQDPRFTAMLAFGKEHFGGDPVFATVEKMSRIVPEILKRQGKAKNPYPNVDFGMGAVWHHFGITETDYYTVPFAISLAMGMLAQLVINRAIGSPILRPRSVTSEWVRSQ